VARHAPGRAGSIGAGLAGAVRLLLAVVLLGMALLVVALLGAAAADAHVLGERQPAAQPQQARPGAGHLASTAELGVAMSDAQAVLEQPAPGTGQPAGGRTLLLPPISWAAWGLSGKREQVAGRQVEEGAGGGNNDLPPDSIEVAGLGEEGATVMAAAARTPQPSQRRTPQQVNAQAEKLEQALYANQVNLRTIDAGGGPQNAQARAEQRSKLAQENKNISSNLAKLRAETPYPPALDKDARKEPGQQLFTRADRIENALNANAKEGGANALPPPSRNPDAVHEWAVAGAKRDDMVREYNQIALALNTRLAAIPAQLAQYSRQAQSAKTPQREREQAQVEIARLQGLASDIQARLAQMTPILQRERERDAYIRNYLGEDPHLQGTELDEKDGEPEDIQRADMEPGPGKVTGEGPDGVLANLPAAEVPVDGMLAAEVPVDGIVTQAQAVEVPTAVEPVDEVPDARALVAAAQADRAPTPPELTVQASVVADEPSVVDRSVVDRSVVDRSSVVADLGSQSQSQTPTAASLSESQSLGYQSPGYMDMVEADVTGDGGHDSSPLRENGHADTWNDSGNSPIDSYVS